CLSDWSSDVCSSDLDALVEQLFEPRPQLDRPDAFRLQLLPNDLVADHDVAIEFGALEVLADDHARPGAAGRFDEMPQTGHRCLRSEEHTSELQSLRH